MNEVVEMPCLQRGILTIVRKPQQLLGFVREFLILLKQIAQGRYGQHRGGGRASFSAEADQTVGIAPPCGVGDAAVQTETETPGDEPAMCTTIRTDAVGFHMGANRCIGLIVAFQSRLATMLFGPILWVVVQIGIVPPVFGVEVEEAEIGTLLVMTSLTNIARSQPLTFRRVLPPDRIVLLSALAAEMNRIEALVPVAGQVLLAAEIQDSLAFGLQCGIERVCTRNELVKPKGEQRLTMPIMGTIDGKQ